MIIVGLNLALFFTLATAAPIGPGEFACTQDGIFGNPGDCLKFIICAHGQRQDFDCPQGTSWHADRGICDTTDLSKCTATGTGTSGSEDVFKQHLLSLLADFKPCHAGETTLAPGVTTENPGQGGNGTTAGNGGGGETTPGSEGGSPGTGATTVGPGETTPGNPGGNGGSTTGNPGGNSGSSPNPDGGNTGTTPGNDGGSSTGNPGGNPTTPNPGQGGNGSTPNPGDGGSTAQPTTVPPPTCPACPIPTEKECPAVAPCPDCPASLPQSCPATPTCPPPAPSPSCPACSTAAACPAAPTCPPHPECPMCPKETEKVCPTVAACPTTTPKPICDAGWKYYAPTKSCYLLGLTRLTNMDAQKQCLDQEANLASSHSEAENMFIFGNSLKTTSNGLL